MRKMNLPYNRGSLCCCHLCNSCVDDYFPSIPLSGGREAMRKWLRETCNLNATAATPNWAPGIWATGPGDSSETLKVVGLYIFLPYNIPVFLKGECWTHLAVLSSFLIGMARGQRPTEDKWGQKQWDTTAPVPLPHNHSLANQTHTWWCGNHEENFFKIPLEIHQNEKST